MVLLEDVTGFLTSNDGNDFRDALLALIVLAVTEHAHSGSATGHREDGPIHTNKTRPHRPMLREWN